nr:MAG TPA: hypothetical protein [Caudoviricetes sp.]
MTFRRCIHEFVINVLRNTGIAVQGTIFEAYI